MEKEKDESIKLMDTPILECSDDCFSVDNHAKALTKFIKSTKTPTVLSIEGGWGVGKTSLLNLIDKNLISGEEEINNYLHIRFDSWKFVFSNDMNKSFLNLVLLNILKIKGFSKWLKDKKDENIDIFKPIANFIGESFIAFFDKHIGTKFLKEYKEKDKNSHTEGQDLRESFKQIIEKVKEYKSNNFKIIISLDDLDRIQPVKAIEIIEIIKNFLDVEGVMFLLVVDKDIIKKGLSEKFNLNDYDEATKENFFDLYFDKIIQLSFTVPVKDKSEEIEIYIRRILNLENKINSEFIAVIKLYLGSNPRSIKRLANIFLLKRIYFSLINKETDSELKEIEDEKFNALFLSSLKAVNKSFSKDFDDEKDNNIRKKFSFVDSEIFNDIEKKTNVVNGNNDSYSNNEERLLYLVKYNNGDKIRKELKELFNKKYRKNLDGTVIYNLLNKGEKNNFIGSIRKKYGLGPLLEEIKDKKIKLTKDGEDFISNYLN